jgi:hypothetical protein
MVAVRMASPMGIDPCGSAPTKMASLLGTAEGWHLRMAGFSELKRDAA